MPPNIVSRYHPLGIVHMMKRHAVLLCPLLLLAACGANGQNRTAHLVDYRLRTALAPDIAANRATVESTGDGDRVTLMGSSLFPVNVYSTDDKYPDIRSSIIEAMVHPSLMRVQVTDDSGLPVNQRETRVHNVMQYFEDNALGSTLEDPSPVGPSPAGLAITIRVQCPRPPSGTGYGNGKSEPICD